MGEGVLIRHCLKFCFPFGPFLHNSNRPMRSLGVLCSPWSQTTRLKFYDKYVAQKLGLGAKPLAGFLFVPPVGVYPLYPLYVVQYGGVQLAVA